jgi:hypothetical protein
LRPKNPDDLLLYMLLLGAVAERQAIEETNPALL